MDESLKKCGFTSQTKAQDYEMIMARGYDTYRDYRADKSGYYILVRPNFEYRRIEVAICNQEHHIVKAFGGQNVQDVYHEIFLYEQEHSVEWFTDKWHLAYLGKELKKAELALYMGNNSYFQE